MHSIIPSASNVLDFHGRIYPLRRPNTLDSSGTAAAGLESGRYAYERYKTTQTRDWMWTEWLKLMCPLGFRSSTTGKVHAEYFNMLEEVDRSFDARDQ